MLGMTEGDEAKTARHIEDPDPIGKRRPYKTTAASTVPIHACVECARFASPDDSVIHSL